MKESEYIEKKLESLVKGCFDPVEGDGLFDTETARSLDKLTAMLKEAVQFSQTVAGGDLSAAPPSRSNYLAAGIKSLHSQLLHVSWQASQIAKGDYSQQLDFMGEFSRAFNWMTEQIAKRESEQNAYRQMMMSVFDSLVSAIFLIDPTTKEIIYLNHTAASLMQANAGQRPSELDDPLLSHIISLQQPGYEPCEIYDPERRRWSIIHADTICWAENQMLWLYNCVDITQEKTERERLTRAAQIDVLTGVYNRFGGTALLDKIMAGMGRGDRLSLCYMDMDGLKRVNDTYGHSEGDRLLIRFVNGVTTTLRERDFVVRMGGDEFLAIFQCQSKAAVDRAMERLIQMFESENDGKTIPVRFSYGVLEINEFAGLSAEQMIKSVDDEMYRHKNLKKAAEAKALAAKQASID